MTSGTPEPPSTATTPVLEYEAPAAPNRTIANVSTEFAWGVLVSQFLVSAGWVLVSTRVPDLRLTGVGPLIGISLFVAVVGVPLFAIALGVRTALLGESVSLPSKLAVYASASGYALQAVVLALALRFLGVQSPDLEILGLAPVVPLFAPLWLVRKKG
jgi:hypothetical protein